VHVSNETFVLFLFLFFFFFDMSIQEGKGEKRLFKTILIFWCCWYCDFINKKYNFKLTGILFFYLFIYIRIRKIEEVRTNNLYL
jgi:hypothetical protein